MSFWECKGLHGQSTGVSFSCLMYGLVFTLTF